ncbi:MAG TPA: Gfo/Idh/MocA family oxidoreductase [Terrimicrobiaceae bacterium]|nr:Gfo/Idh/MocA family oxidoreductase [Terrimicrobiaceae bacterium]
MENPTPPSTNPLTRRGLIKASLATGAGLVLSRPATLFGQTPSSDLNIGIIGVGAQGRILLDAMANIPGLRFQAVCDIWPFAQTFAKNRLKKAGHDVRTYVDYEDMLAKEKDLDAVIVATPDFWHAPHTVGCLKAGKHVYCEKMMSNTVEGARSMVAAARESGKLLQIGHQRRSNPRYLFALENLIRKQKLCGRLTAANAQWNRAVSEDIGWPKNYELPDDVLKKYGYRDMQQFRNWRWYRDLSGGPISDLGAHQIDIFNWFFGTGPHSVLAGGGADYYKREWYDNVMCIFDYHTPEGTARAFYQVLTTTSSGGGYFETFMGDQATIKISENPKLTKVYREANAPEWDDLIAKNYLVVDKAGGGGSEQKVDVRETAALVSYDIPVTLDKALHQPHLENFFHAIRGSAKLNCDGAHAFASEAAIFKVNDAVEAQKMLFYTPEDFQA